MENFNVGYRYRYKFGKIYFIRCCIVIIRECIVIFFRNKHIMYVRVNTKKSIHVLPVIVFIVKNHTKIKSSSLLNISNVYETLSPTTTSPVMRV